MAIRGNQLVVEPTYMDEEWCLEGDAGVLFHGTSTRHKASILENGFQAGSHWGSEAVARYFARRECDDAGGRPLVFAVPLVRFDAGAFSVDEAMVEFPIFSDYDVRGCEWEDAEERLGDPDWMHGLRIWESVVYGAALRVSAEGILMPVRFRAASTASVLEDPRPLR